MSETYFETLVQTVDYAIIRATYDRRVLLTSPGDAREEMISQPINYNQVRRFDFAIELLRDKPTKKYFHVVITRLDSGRYELVTYVL